jgi:hypothetical protein
MEARAPYHTSAAKAPRNLAAAIATWLREQGFKVEERYYDDTLATVGATWMGSRGDSFELAYIWTSGRHANATLQLQARWLGHEPQNLFGSQQVCHLREVRLLLLGNVRYANARTLATLPHPAL